MTVRAKAIAIPRIEDSREAGVEHNVINANDFEFVFVELELKRRGV